MLLKRFDDILNEKKKTRYGTFAYFIERHGILNEKGEYDFEHTIKLSDFKDSKKYVKDGKFTIKFGHITGQFICSNLGLTSFENFPHTITGQLTAANNDFGNLIGIPKAKGYILYECGLTSLEGSPKSVDDGFLVSYNKELKSLEGGPKVVGSAYRIDDCAITGLKGSPIKINGFFTANGNKILTLQDMPTMINGHVDITGNDIRTLKDFVWSPNLSQFDIQKNPNLPTLYGIVKKDNIPSVGLLNMNPFSNDEDLICKTELNFVTWTSDINKETYWDELLDYAIKNGPEDIIKIKWPIEFVEKIGNEKMKNLIKSGQGINKYNI